MRKFLVVLFCLSIQAYGDDQWLETITVTASRTPLELRDTGSSVSIITGDEIRARNVTNLGELLREIPGMAVSQQGSQGALTQVRVRGAEANQLLVLIDGVEVNDLSQGGEFNFTHLLTSQIERVEIVKGPQSALWGSDALAGVVNVITAPQNPSGTTLSGYIDAGSFSTIRTGFGMRSGKEKLQTSLSIDYVDTDGTNISRNGSEDDGYRNLTLNFSGEYEMTGNSSVSWLLRNTDSKTGFDSIDFFTTGLPVDAGFTTNSRQTYGNISLAWQPGSVEQILTLARTDTENINRTDSPVRDITRGVRDQLRYQINYLKGSHILTALLEYEDEDYEQRGNVSFFGDPNRDLGTTSRNVAAEYRYDGSAIDFSLSARYENNSDFDDSRSYRATLAWHLPGDVTDLYASVGQAVKNPTFTERFGFFDTFFGNPDLKPEKSRGMEIGLRQSFLNDDLTMDATWFSTRLEDEINGFVFDPVAGGFTAENVTGRSDREGLEVSVHYRLSETIRITSGWTWLKARQPDPAGGKSTEVRRPEHSASLNLDYQGRKTGLNLGMIYTGNQKDDFFPPFPPFQERVTLDGFTLVNLAATYRLTGSTTLTLRLSNLFDKRYEEVYGYASPGFSVSAGVRVGL